MLSQIGIPGVIILLIICIVAFGAKNLPDIGRSVGESLKEFKGAFNDERKAVDQESNQKEGQ
ncbi:hypothetical protein GCM10011409_22820 [Lentibacillus populi]|uniref:Sec-independent protein translocase protein TatA n=1 Tax=Lentibacillus populi TaxID=1827502 RepID=A0A9W5TYC3_9BACI|nr:twin-arginine translocase TatA/TatE family subunit [Lentibacillus populi]GGB44670.1 hypothetical protein GCM10011409_22820 [Lentibacillus populi]